MIHFHTDLDNTLIYSYKHDIGAEKLCAEIYEGREVSFITKETSRLLQEIKKQGKQIEMIPTTTRTKEQYNRVHLGQNFRYALVCNGGVLLVEGEEDEDWYKESLELIEDSRKELHQALRLLEREERRNFELRFIRELFVFTKCEEPEAVAESLRKNLDARFVDVFTNGVKIYVLPKALHKGKAVERFLQYEKADFVVGAGDSAFDISMLEAADFGIAPPRLFSSYPFSEKVKCPRDGKLFAESVLGAVLKFLV